MTTLEAISVLERVLKIVAYSDEAYSRNELVYAELKHSTHEHRLALEYLIPRLKQAQETLERVELVP